ncbi:MAG: toll/interleukin-1 receptor domain-containing protein [Bacteroidetes bacterium]|nr:MAG: toll/interleukin-1 receptor domain-containing protein [Bacteroidota bacterium]
MTQNKKVFISYKREEAELAMRLTKELSNDNIHTWIDLINIKPGSHWDNEIEAALREIDILLVILTPASVSSPNVMNEISYALRLKKKVIPLLMEHCEIPLQLSRIQYVDFINSYKNGIEQLGSTIKDETIFKPVIPPKKSFKKAKRFIISLILAFSIFPFKWLFEFKGIIYDNPKIIGDSSIQVNFINTVTHPYNNLGITIWLNDTGSMVHNFKKVLIFDKRPVESSFRRNAEECLIANSNARTVMQPIVEKGNYSVSIPFLKKNKSLITDNSIEVVIGRVNSNCQYDSNALVSSRRMTFLNYFFLNPWLLFFFVVVMGFTIQLFVSKRKK